MSVWSQLKVEAAAIQKALSQNAFHNKERRLVLKDFTLDYSHQLINDRVLSLLLDLAKERNLDNKIYDLLHGEKVNYSEQQPALHTALRAPSTETICIDGTNVMEAITRARLKIQTIAEQVRSQQWLGFWGDPITDVVNIGIGGSDFGPRFALKALSAYVTTNIHFHFISDADPASFTQTVAHLNPKTTLFITTSKSFTTYETLYNTQKAMRWLNHPAAIKKHCIAITAHPHMAKEIGIETILPLWPWVGGRYSFCSSVNLITAIALGYEEFEQMLAGAHHMDTHFKSADFIENLPVLLGLIGVWNINFLEIHNLLFLIYAQELSEWVSYVQQLDMESNGKSVDVTGKFVDYATSPIIWGGLGNQAQHSYYQLLCQGTHRVTADFISVATSKHEVIYEMCQNKIQVLSAGIGQEHDPHNTIAGGMPLNHLSLQQITPFNVGALVALYEHKTYVQSVIWKINPFDQPGVERAKKALRGFLQPA